MHDCPCCSHAVYSDDANELCEECAEHDCEANREGVYDSCNVPEEEDEVNNAGCVQCGNTHCFC